MTFDKILDNNTLWAVRYDSVADNALKTLFDQWSDPEWLVEFFLANMADLESLQTSIRLSTIPLMTTSAYSA